MKSKGWIDVADFKPKIESFDGFVNRVRKDDRGNMNVLIGMQPGYKQSKESEFVPQGDYLSFSVTVPQGHPGEDVVKSIRVDGDGKPTKRGTKLFFRGGIGFTVQTKPKNDGGVWTNIYIRLPPWGEVSTEPWQKGGKKADPEVPTDDDFDSRF
jgi:hypothetical protein